MIDFINDFPYNWFQNNLYIEKNFLVALLSGPFGFFISVMSIKTLLKQQS